MPGNPFELITMAECQFPVRFRIAVPPMRARPALVRDHRLAGLESGADQVTQQGSRRRRSG
jgi:hypothetical protein